MQGLKSLKDMRCHFTFFSTGMRLKDFEKGRGEAQELLSYNGNTMIYTNWTIDPSLDGKVILSN